MATKQNTAKPLLQRAHEIIHGERQNDYGNTLVNFAQIAAFWNAHLALKLSQPITPEDVAMMMLNLKQARLSKSPDHADSILDVAGYAGCYDKLRNERAIWNELPGILQDHGAS